MEFWKQKNAGKQGQGSFREDTVKTGGGKGAAAQLLDTATVTEKKVIAYIPKAKLHVAKDIQRNNFDLFRTMEELIEFISKN